MAPSSEQKRRATVKMEVIVSSEMLILATKIHGFTSLKDNFQKFTQERYQWLALVNELQ
jgi:hypothetical protein